MDTLFIISLTTILKNWCRGYGNVLKGARKKLKEVSFVLIEHQFGNHYKNVNFALVDKYLKDNNFRVIKDFYFPTLHYKDILYKKNWYL